jgi:tetratricopeptide (TPR) repeat protein
MTGEAHTARGILEEALSIAAGRGDSRAKLRLDLGRLDLEQGNIPRAIRHLELARQDAGAEVSDYQIAEILKELALAQGLSGEEELSAGLILDSLSAARRASGHRGEASWEMLLALAETCAEIGVADRARGYLLDALQGAESERSLPGKLQITMQMAKVHEDGGEWDEAEMRLLQALDLVVQIGDRTCEAAMLIDIGRLYRIRGDVERARKRLDQAVQRARAVGWWDGLKQVEREVEMLRYAMPNAL